MWTSRLTESAGDGAADAAVVALDVSSGFSSRLVWLYELFIFLYFLFILFALATSILKPQRARH
jgi:hypothetical protein